MIKMNLIADSHTYDTRVPDTDDEWDRGDSHTDWSVEGLRIVKDYGDLQVAGPVEPGDIFYVIYAIWSTGDSFGHDSCARCEGIIAHRKREVAEENRRRLEKPWSDRDGYDAWTVRLLTDDGEEFPYHRPWLGYFESLETLTIEQLEVVN